MTARHPALVVRADAGTTIGAGHVVRSLALAQAWRDRGGAAAYVGQCASPWIADLLRRERLECHPLDTPHPDPRDLRETVAAAERLGASGAVWVAVDGYHFDAGYHRALRRAGVRVVVMDDCAHLPAYGGDLVVNPNLSSEGTTYRLDPGALLLAGPRFALLRREFRERGGRSRTTAARASRFLVLTGGGAAAPVRKRLLDAVRAAGWGDGEGRVVVGPLDTGEEAAEAVSSLGAGWRILRGADDMSALMSWADVAVTAGGGAVWELASVGTPIVAVTTALNQEASVRSLADLGVALPLGRATELSASDAAPVLRDIREDAGTRLRMGELGRRMVDGRGADRVVRAMTVSAEPGGPADFVLRVAAAEDAFLLWRWASDPVVRRNSFSQAPIPWEGHLDWFSQKLASGDSRLWILEYRSIPAATIRYDRTDANTARISFSVAAPFRGRGFAGEALRISAPRAARELGVNVLEGDVLPDNVASARSFLAAGFREVLPTGRLSAGRVFRKSAADAEDGDGR